MKRINLYSISSLITLLLVFVSCQKNELDATYKGVSRIVIAGDPDEGARADSLLFSFSAYQSSVEESVVSIIAQTMGNLSDEPRTFQLKVDASLTTALPEEYQFPETVTIAPQAYQAVVPVTIRRTERIKESNIKLALRVVPTADFEPGPEVPGNLVNAGPSFAIVWNDQFTKPAIWEQTTGGYLSTLGKWSRVKHQLIVDLTGIRDLSNLTTLQRYTIQAAGLEFLAAYAREHPENPSYLNEWGQAIGFCRTCN